tara:strand:- start:1324 stop:1902 length:579 start_codon:yes stop_codon:yes gene_type:complete
MIKETYFPTSIYIKDFDLDNDVLANEILKIQKEDPDGMWRSNVGEAYHSKNNLHTLPQFYNVRDLIFDTCKDICYEQKVKTPIMFVNLWGNVNGKGGSNDTHLHGNAFLSGVYYVKTPENSGAIRFIDPRPQVEILAPEREEPLNRDDWNRVMFKPTPGKLLVFPGYLPHQVFANQSDDLRISMSFNVALKL